MFSKIIRSGVIKYRVVGMEFIDVSMKLGLILYHVPVQDTPDALHIRFVQLKFLLLCVTYLSNQNYSYNKGIKWVLQNDWMRDSRISAIRSL
jgi:hypothetical protein